MPNQRSIRSSQRSVLVCTNCARRKVRCSKTIPCTACVRQNQAGQCQREEVAVVTRRSTAHDRPSGVGQETRFSSVSEANSPAGVPLTPADPIPGPSLVPSAATTGPNTEDVFPSLTHQSLEQLLASASTSTPTLTPENRMTNEAAAALEFLAHGRRNVLNRFVGRDSAPGDGSVDKWDTVLPLEDARALLDFHETHIAWMHNVVHIPTFRRELDENVRHRECDRTWIALYYALLSQTLYHIDGDYLSALPHPISAQANIETSRALFDKSIETLHQAKFMDRHKLASVQTICLLVQVAHNFDKSDLICVLISTGIRIAQCLNLHRLGHDRPICRNTTQGSVDETINREVRKRVWWFLVRYDWLQIPFQNTCQIYMSQFNTPMPSNCHDDIDRMVKNGVVNSQPNEMCTSITWTNCLSQLAVLMWRYQARVSTVGSPETDADNMLELYDQVIRADGELKELYSSWSLALRDTYKTPNGHIMIDSFPTQLMPAMLLISTAQKIFTVHRQFQLLCFRDRRFAFSQVFLPSYPSGVPQLNNFPMQLSCITIAERSIEAFQRWPDCLETRICRRMWTTLSYVISCCITLLFALLFKSQNALTHDLERIRRYVEFGKDFIQQDEQISSIARRGVRLLGALMDLERTSEFSIDIEADIADTIRRVAMADEDGLEVNLAEACHIIFPYGQDLWESLIGDPLGGDLLGM